jgi:predicted DNA-binding transcriptional regulator YafY
MYILERRMNAVVKRDGSAVLTVRANSFAWVARWVVGYGKEAKIIVPTEAAHELTAIVK